MQVFIPGRYNLLMDFFLDFFLENFENLKLEFNTFKLLLSMILDLRLYFKDS